MNPRTFRTLLAGLLTLGASAFAQEMVPLQSADLALGEIPAAPSPAQPTHLLTTLHKVYTRPSPLALADAKTFSFMNAFAWTEATSPDFLPAFVGPPMLLGVPVVPSSPRSNDGPVKLLSKFDYATGEVSVLYGKSIGGGGGDREVKAGYILGQIGNQNTQINVGASYLNSSGHFPKFRR